MNDQSFQANRPSESSFKWPAHFCIFLGVSAFLGVATPCEAEQTLNNVGRQLFYDHTITLYDTSDRATETRQVVDSVPPFSGATALRPSGSVQAIGGGFLDAGSYELSSIGEGTSGFDIKGGSFIQFNATQMGTYSDETGADGVWDYVEASAKTGVSFYDVVTVTSPSLPSGSAGQFQFHWAATNNKLEVSQVAVEEVFGQTSMGPLSRRLNGFHTELDYQVELDVKVDGVSPNDIPYSLDGTEIVAAPTATDELPLERVRDFLDQDVKFSLPATIGQPMVVQVDLTLGLDMTMEVIGEGQPEFEAFLDFTNTFDSIRFDVLDASGNVIQDATVTSQLGIDYLGATAGTAVPEPSSGVLVAMICVYALTRRRRRKTESRRMAT